MMPAADNSQVYSADLTPHELQTVVGALDENLRQVENAFSVQVIRRGSHFRFVGANAEKAAAAGCMPRLAVLRDDAHSHSQFPGSLFSCFDGSQQFKQKII